VAAEGPAAGRGVLDCAADEHGRDMAASGVRPVGAADGDRET
jgi:hypothetical protein